ncbi:hypothetical protein SAMN05518672_113163 [Chitinophaga sp. CF118]|uniref:hypothetical protein n=1 Tax=Chitinophaga sp. CF118 TaxID=1884367 RepID=UPI0008E79C4A|nr:hypothetical protein [Chitinophaga sp. CF118]SFE98618.1 hypothetical protein SAMN05518672_113163 [Chitinophaga sp. CF118]
MSLDELEILFDEDDLDIDAPTREQLYSMYGHFLNDFHKTPLIHKGRKVIFNKNLSRSPLFKGKFEGFVHAVTRKSQYTNKRQYDRDRANRIHWIKPILDNWESSWVSYFERLNDEGQLQYFYWVQSLNFLVILRELTPDLLLVTSYCTDAHNIGQFRRYLNEYRARK